MRYLLKYYAFALFTSSRSKDFNPFSPSSGDAVMDLWFSVSVSNAFTVLPDWSLGKLAMFSFRDQVKLISVKSYAHI